jgi:hypothetical protein
VNKLVIYFGQNKRKEICSLVIFDEESIISMKICIHPKLDFASKINRTNRKHKVKKIIRHDKQSIASN